MYASNFCCYLKLISFSAMAFSIGILYCFVFIDVHFFLDSFSFILVSHRSLCRLIDIISYLLCIVKLLKNLYNTILM